MTNESGVWVGLRRCGCCRAVVVDNPEYQTDVEKSKREFLEGGLSVVYATWQEWLDKYSLTMKVNCPHMPAKDATVAKPNGERSGK